MNFISNEQARGDCYRLFAVFFYPPERKMLLEEAVCENLFRLLMAVCPEAASCAEEMAGELSISRDEDLAVAHAKLFVGPFELQAPPYGSVYLDTHKRLMGDSTIEVLRMYQGAGLAFRDDFKNAPDHIAVELEFMQFLIAKEVRALYKDDTEEALDYLKIQHEFNDRYLCTWIEPFCERVKTASDQKFYRLLAACLLTFIMKTPVPETLPG